MNDILLLRTPDYVLIVFSETFTYDLMCPVLDIGGYKKLGFFVG